MDWLLAPISADRLFELEQFLGDAFFWFSLVFLGVELIRYAFRRRLTWGLTGDTAANFVTLALFIGLSYIVFAAFYVSALFFFHRFAVFDIGTNWLTVAICVVLADFAYYWEHRFTHRVGIAWATHTVHHSSPHFNISVAYRFGPLDGVWPLLFHIPLVVAGFNPLVVLLAELLVQLYQTALHTEIIRKLPRPIEAIMNTPSHHRVHHGSNDEYIDKNYGGIFIVWDRLFGTFAEERETVVYGLTRPIESVNPFVIFLHGFTRLWREVCDTPGVANKLRTLLMPPGWSAGVRREGR